jgi:hypothetical protein
VVVPLLSGVQRSLVQQGCGLVATAVMVSHVAPGMSWPKCTRYSHAPGQIPRYAAVWAGASGHGLTLMHHSAAQINVNTERLSAFELAGVLSSLSGRQPVRLMPWCHRPGSASMRRTVWARTD